MGLMVHITLYFIIGKILPKKKVHLKQKAGTIFADGLLNLGPLYIKIGQILSCGDGLLPDEWKVPLERLQDNVPAREGQAARDLAYQAYDGGKEGFDKVFMEFDDVPIAAASLGQVHRAKLRSDGATVALKVQRPKLREIYDKDLALMQKIALVVDGVTEGIQKMRSIGSGDSAGGGISSSSGLSWVEIFSDAEEILYREINYQDEANNARRFANDFGLGYGGQPILPLPSLSSQTEQEGVLDNDGKTTTTLPSAASWLRTPYVYDELSTESVLVMEYVPSMKITDLDSLKKAGVTEDDQVELAENLAKAYLRMFCSHRFFSTDPHPGNLGVEIVEDEQDDANRDGDLDDGNRMMKKKVRSRLVFYDLGQACSLKNDQADGILDVIEGIVDLDVDSCVGAFDRMGVLVDGADLTKIKAKVQNNFDTGMLKVKDKKKKKMVQDDTKTSDHSTTPDAFPSSSSSSNQTTVAASATTTAITTEGQEQVKNKEIMSYFTLPAEYAFVARALSQMDGVGKTLDPDFDFISACAPYIVEIKGGGKKYVEDKMKKTLSKWEKQLEQYRVGFVKALSEAVTEFSTD